MSLAAAAIGRIEGPVDYAIPTLRAALQEGKFSRTPSWLMFFPTGQSTLGSSVGLSPAESAAWLLAETGPPAKEALPELEAVIQNGRSALRNWRDGNSSLRILSARAIWRISKDGTSTAPVLSESFRMNPPGQKDELTFFVALRALEEMGPAAKSATPALVDFVNQRKNRWNDRRKVLMVLRSMDPDMADRISLKLR